MIDISIINDFFNKYILYMSRKNKKVHEGWSDRQSYKEHIVETDDGRKFKLYDPGRDQPQSYSKSLKEHRRIYDKVKEYAKENNDEVDGDKLPFVDHYKWYDYLSRAAYETGEGWGKDEKFWILSKKAGERGWSDYLGLSPMDTIRKSKKRKVEAAGAGDGDEQEAKKVAAPKVPSDEVESEEKVIEKVSAKKDRIRGRECTIEGVKYACNMETGKIYDLESFMEYIRGDREEPFLVGEDFEKDGKKMIRIDRDKLDEIKKQHEEKKKKLEEEKERKEQEEYEKFVKSLTPVTYKGKKIFYGPFDDRAHSYPLYSESEDGYNLIGDYEPDSIFTKEFDENKLDNFVIQYRGYDTETDSSEEEVDHAAQIQAEIEEQEKWEREMEEQRIKQEKEYEENERKKAEQKRLDEQKAKEREENERKNRSTRKLKLRERMKKYINASTKSTDTQSTSSSSRPPAAGDDNNNALEEQRLNISRNLPPPWKAKISRTHNTIYYVKEDENGNRISNPQWTYPEPESSESSPSDPSQPPSLTGGKKYKNKYTRKTHGKSKRKTRKNHRKKK